MIVEKLIYGSPVAVTPQTTEKVTVLLAGTAGNVIPPPCSEAIVTAPGKGQDAPPDVPVQLVCVQFSPDAIGSLSTAPSASDGPPLLTVIV